MSSFTHMATVSASTKRSPDISGGKRGAPAGFLTGLHCFPLDPVDPEIRQRLALDTPHELLQTFIESADIVEGDILVVGDKEYPIKNCSEWTWRGSLYLSLILEDLKR